MRHYELQRQLQYKQTASQVTNSSNRFSRDDLKEAAVINQVDSKFIACLLPSDPVTDDVSRGSGASPQAPSRTLVLVDQHAADERVRVEWLQREICLGYLRNDGTGVERIVLDPPVPILLTRHEKLILHRNDDIRDLLASWGVEFAPINDAGRDDHSDDDDNYSQVAVTSIPEIVSNRVRARLVLPHIGADGRASYLRGMICSISSRGYLSITRMKHSEGRLLHLSHNAAKTNSRGKVLYGIAPPSSWICSTPRLAEVRDVDHFSAKNPALISDPPGAIMFNDPLTVEQCEELMERLSHTAVPFRCAHGRPSIVPLVDLGPPADLRGATRHVNWEAYGDYIQAQARY